jgi:hypothetical protein
MYQVYEVRFSIDDAESAYINPGYLLAQNIGEVKNLIEELPVDKDAVLRGARVSEKQPDWLDAINDIFHGIDFIREHHDITFMDDAESALWDDIWNMFYNWLKDNGMRAY